MSLSIRTNYEAIRARAWLVRNSADLAKTNQQLASGLRINSGADDAAGLAISSLMSAKLASIKQNQDNIAQAMSLAKIADGALGDQASILSRLMALAIQSANDTLGDPQRFATIQPEVDALLEQFNKIAMVTEFNGILLLAGKSPEERAPIPQRLPIPLPRALAPPELERKDDDREAAVGRLPIGRLRRPERADRLREPRGASRDIVPGMAARIDAKVAEDAAREARGLAQLHRYKRSSSVEPTRAAPKEQPRKLAERGADSEGELAPPRAFMRAAEKGEPRRYPARDSETDSEEDVPLGRAARKEQPRARAAPEPDTDSEEDVPLGRAAPAPDLARPAPIYLQPPPRRKPAPIPRPLVLTIQSGPYNDENSRLTIEISPSIAASFRLGNLELDTKEKAQEGIDVINRAIANMAGRRAEIGAVIS